jgi:hypothetical protein
MSWWRVALGAVMDWVERATPTLELAALPLLVAGALAARRALRRRARPSAALALARVWAEMLALSCLLLLAGWAVSRASGLEGPFWAWQLTTFLLAASLVPPAHALRCTLLRFAGRPGDGDPGAETLRYLAWLAFAAVTMLCAHAVGMHVAFPYSGGEFHAMFAYTDEGRVGAALAAWRASVLILGGAALVFAVWIPLPWWTSALLAVAVGLMHWSHVAGWRVSPQSPHFHHTVITLFVAMPFAILAIAAAGALLRRWMMRRRPAAPA